MATTLIPNATDDEQATLIPNAVEGDQPLELANTKLSPQDRDLMIRTVIGEASDQSDTGKAAVAHVILNRLKAGDWGKSPAEVVLQKGQFEPWQTRARELLNIKPNSDSYKSTGDIVDAAAAGKIEDPTKGATYFLQPDVVRQRRGGTLPDWATGPSMKIGGHMFYYGGRGGPNMAQNVSDADISDTARAAGIKYDAPAPTAITVTPGDKSAVKPADIDETLKLLGLKKTIESINKPVATPAAGMKPEPLPPGVPARAPLKITVGGPQELPKPGYTDQVVQGMPLVGPLFNKGVAASEAALSPLINMIKGRQTADTYGDRYDTNLAKITGDQNQFAKDNPVGSTAANLVGGGMMLGPLARVPYLRALLGAGGPSLLTKIVTGGTGGAGLGGLDAALRGTDPKEGAVYGGAGGTVAPLVGGTMRGITNWLTDNVLPRTGILKGLNSKTVQKLSEAYGGETPSSTGYLAQRQMGPAGFVADINHSFTDLAGGVADIPGPGKQIVRDAYANRAAQQKPRVKAALDDAMGGPATNIEHFKNFLTETRKAAADPLYEQWRTMKVHPTDKLKGLIPRLEKAGAFSKAEELAGVTGEPINMKFFTGGKDKEFPTAQTWDYVKQGLDRSIDGAYKSGDKQIARALVKLKHELINEIEKTDAGQVWNQARQEFADRSAIMDQIDAGRDTFLGGRSALSVDELREELRGLGGPEKAARIVGARSAADEAIGASMRGDTSLRNKLLADNNIEKMRLLLGKDKADGLVRAMEQERFLATQKENVTGNSQTTPKKERVNALLPGQSSEWDPNLTKPLTWLPPSLVHELRPSTAIERWQAKRAGDTLSQLAPLLTIRSAQPEFNALMKALRRENLRRGSLAGGAEQAGGALSALIAGETPSVVRRAYSAQP